MAGGALTDGAGVIQWPCGTSASQDWRAVSVGRGTCTLRNAHSDKCAEVFQESTQDGAPVDQWTCTGGAHQSWRLRRVG